MQKAKWLVAVVIGLVLLTFADNPHVPRGAVLVVDQTFSGETSLVSSVLLTPTASATYRVSVYVEIAGTVSGSTFLETDLDWTDDVASRSAFNSNGTGQNFVCVVSSGQSYCYGTAVIHAVANAPIVINFGENGTMSLPANGSYTSYVLVEQL